ncbi:MAG: M20/M25/M40 family metallo-hydrolase [Veillonellaceae bacterium]|nr:M20/M25/M40 family metallo-hydrolase [Veillonellaceae bacterium]
MSVLSKRGRSLSVLVALFVILTVSVPALAATDTALLERAQGAEALVLTELEQLVNIDSPADHAAGLNQIQGILSTKLKSMGAEIRTVPSPRGSYNIVATFTGTGTGKLLLMAHVDTVFKVGAAQERPFRIQGDRAYGPGVSDDKGPVLTGLYAIKLLQDSGFKDYAKITYLLNVDEEIGSPSSKELIKELAQQHDYAICLEGGRSNDGVVSFRKGISYLQIEAKGRASHAGNAPEKGVNALLELVEQIPALARLADPDKGTTVSFTVFQSGDKTNVIPDKALAKADIRVLLPEEMDRLEKEAAEVVTNKLLPESQIKLTITRGRPPFPQNAATDALIEKAQVVYQEIGKTLSVAGSGGGSDGNYTASVGTPTLDSLGFVGGGAHGVNEYMEIKSIAPRLYLLSRLLMDLGSGK